MKYIKVLLVLIVIYLLFFKTSNLFSQTIKSIDLIPIDDSFLIYESSFGNKNKKIGGYFDGIKSSINFVNYSNNVVQTTKPKIIYNNSKGIIFENLYDFNYYANNNWEFYSSYEYLQSDQNSYNCFELENSIIGGKESNCKVNSKNFFQSEIDGSIKPAILIKSNGFTIKSAMRRTSKSYNKKTIFQYGIGVENINDQITFGSGFENIRSNKLSILRDNKFIISNFNIKFGSSIKLSKNWGLGFDLDQYFFISDKKTEQNKLFFPDQNLILRAKVTRKFAENYYLSLNFLDSSNNTFGYRPVFGSSLYATSLNSRYRELSLSFGLLKEKVNIDNTSKNIITTINKEVKRKMKHSQKNFNKKSKARNKKVENTTEKINLFQFAINYAKNYDNINLSL